MRKLIFTDLDGTLLDYKTYSYKKASKALSLIKKDKIPLIFCTSKTKAEIEYYGKELNNKHLKHSSLVHSCMHVQLFEKILVARD